MEDRYKARLQGAARGPMAGAKAVLDAAHKAAQSTSGSHAPKAAKKGSCEARLTSLFSSIAPEVAPPPPSRIASGPSGAETHEKRLADVFGSLMHTLTTPAVILLQK